MMCSNGKRPQRQRGVALVLVLWAIALMAVLLGSFALIATPSSWNRATCSMP